MSLVLLSALSAGLGAALLLPAGVSRPSAPTSPGALASTWSSGESRLRRLRLPLSALAASAVWILVDGVVGLAGALVVAAAAFRALSRSEPPGVAAARGQATQDLPYLVLLLASGLRAGAAPGPALARACEALPGAAVDRLRPSVARLAVGVPTTQVWRELAADPVLAPLGTALSRSAESGASVVETVERLSDDLAAEARAGVEDRARTVGVRAALPLGLCLLPAFVLLGIVPLVAAMLEGLLPG